MAPASTSITGTSTTGGDQPRVIAVVVTYNRRDLLTESLSAVLAQSRAPDAVIVMDNASTDGTAEMVAARFPSVRLAVARRNTGGAGDKTKIKLAGQILQGALLSTPLARRPRSLMVLIWCL